MDIEKVYSRLTSILTNSKVLKNEPMSKHTSFKIGGNADILVKANTEEDVKSVLTFSNREDIPIYVMGNGSNILVKDNGIRGIVLMICIDTYKIEKQDKKVIATLGAGVKLAGFAQELLKQGITGFEFAAGIPGTIGGAIRMNAGAHGKEMKDIVVTTTYIDEYGNLKTISDKEQEFSYRNSIFNKHKWTIINTVLEFEYGNKEEIQEKMQEYAKYRKEKQPITYPSAGSTFKRGEDFITAKLIDECGLKGYSIGGAKISEIHAGFIINIGNATAEDVLKLVEYTSKRVYEKFGKIIELEIEVIGE